mmetsp:Transcript_70000/g.216436  ORF Transcript_70000/g.216436 Transcript_70000/m.216436 type:complete len:496 (-) Transcript_70000:20-1507(-)
MRLLTTISTLLAAARVARAYAPLGRADGGGVLAPDLREEFSEAAVTFSSSLAAPADDRHPFWIFDREAARGAQVLECAVVLVLAGLLCSAGGIGGGGIYVSVLMVVGKLTPRDAVPLSKAVVFSGSIASLVLNLGRSMSGKSGQSRPLIDYSICRLVVPSALLGTLFGVVINRNAADAAIVLILSAILLGMTGMVIWTTYSQYMEEETEAAAALLHAAHPRPDVELPRADGGSYPRENAPEGGQGGHHARPTLSKSRLTSADKYGSLALLLCVVASGVIRHHASACVWELEHGSERSVREVACRHPTLTFFMGNQLERWMADPSGPSVAMLLTLAVPLSVCLGVLAYISRDCVQNEGWAPLEVAKYEVMGVLTGCLAGLIGIGGGLVFSPFFLVMGVEPAVAVATSSTCVIFTSSSTTMQYLFTDRIITSLTLIYGLANLVASYGGTAFVHFVQDRFARRRSYVTAIVALGVLVSAILSMSKLVSSTAAGGSLHF